MPLVTIAVEAKEPERRSAVNTAPRKSSSSTMLTAIAAKVALSDIGPDIWRKRAAFQSLLQKLRPWPMRSSSNRMSWPLGAPATANKPSSRLCIGVVLASRNRILPISTGATAPICAGSMP